LALSWKYGDGNKTFSMTLRPHVKFSDGTSFNAAAVKIWIRHEIATPGGLASSVFANLKAIDVTAPLKVKFVFSAPEPDLELDLSQVLEMGMVGSPKAVAAKTLATATDGAGEYELDASQTVTGDHYTLVPNPHYWNKSAVHWKKVVIEVITNPTAALQALQTGQVQVADAQPVTSISAAKSAALKFIAPPELIEGLTLSDRAGTLVPALGNIKVRQALNYAVDRTALAQLVGSGYGTAIDQFAVPGDDSYDPALKNAYPYDPAKAKQLLAAAGYPNGFTFTLDTTSLVGESTLAQAVQGELASVGVTVNLDNPSVESEYTTKLATDPAATIGWGRLPAFLDEEFLYGPSATQWNPFKSTSPQLTTLFNKLATAPPTKTAVYARKIQDFISTNAWFVPIAATPLVYLYSPKVTGVTATNQRGTEYAVEIKPA
jgi:peptide/nickel transport system substrate-binding protein